MVQLFLFVLFFAFGAAVFFLIKKTRSHEFIIPADLEDLLESHVAYYRELTSDRKKKFEERVRVFLSYIRIHGVNTKVENLDRVLVASSAIIPVFGFEDWRYFNLKDVLLYGDRFNAEDYAVTGDGRNTLGMVGDGPMQRMMILSKPALRQGFINETQKVNTGIHEFVHLLDKADGATDGIPEALLHRQYVIPWIKYMRDAMSRIKAGKSDIDPYGAVSQAEFFEVVSEYFFKRPDLLRINHPDLYGLLEKAFSQYPGQK